jgi:putative thioredoxin
MDLADLHIARREFPQALEQLLEIVRRNPHFRDDGARLRMLSVFEMAAADPDLVTDFRSRLSSLLF